MESEHYEKYVNLIRKAVWDRVNGHGLEFDDLMGWGNIAYCEALRTYDPEKGAFSTHLTNWLKYELGRAVQAAYGYRNNTTGLDEANQVPDAHNPEREFAFGLAMASLRPEARQVVDMVINTPLEFCDLTKRSVKITMGGIRSYLKSMGWGHRQIERAFTEVRKALKNL